MVIGRDTVRGAAAGPAGHAGRPGVRRLLTSRAYLGNTIAFAFSFAAMMAYISASPFVHQELMGLDALQYGLAFGINALGLLAATWASARLTARVSVPRLAGIGLTTNALAVLALLLLALSPADSRWLLAPIFVAVTSLGLVSGNTTALALLAVREASGTASAFLGLLQFLLAGAVAPLVSLGGTTSALPLALTMLVATAIANTAFHAAGNHRPGARTP